MMFEKKRIDASLRIVPAKTVVSNPWSISLAFDASLETLSRQIFLQAPEKMVVFAFNSFNEPQYYSFARLHHRLKKFPGTLDEQRTLPYTTARKTNHAKMGAFCKPFL